MNTLKQQSTWQSSDQLWALWEDEQDNRAVVNRDGGERVPHTDGVCEDGITNWCD